MFQIKLSSEFFGRMFVDFTGLSFYLPDSSPNVHYCLSN